jgi:inner membrane transporter RhtA
MLIDALPAATGAVWLRLGTAAVIFGIIALVRWVVGRVRSVATPARRPKPRSAWILAVAWSAALLTMNFAIYEAFARIPVGIAVTLEFLGPITVALLGSRRRLDFLWVALAAGGVLLLGFRPQPLDWIGVVFVLLAATAWGGYITLGAKLADHFRSGDVLMAACGAGAVIFAIPSALDGTFAVLNWQLLGLGALVGLACSVIPYTLDLFALGKIAPSLFAILNSLAPAVAALAAWALIDQALGHTDWLAIGCVITASIGATLGQYRQSVITTP